MSTDKIIYKRIVVIGAGFAGLSAVKELNRAPVEIILIDQFNHHLFQPLLYQVATAGLSPADIALPIRHILSKQRNVKVMMEKVVAISKANQIVITSGGNRYPYDYLVIATGAQHSYFNHKNWSDYAPGLKCLREALFIREKILLAFEEAEINEDLAIRTECLTFVIIGGGPTGVEMAGAVRELATQSLANQFNRINPASARVILIEAGARILKAFPEKLAWIAERKLRRMGVEICLNQKVVDIEKNCVKLAAYELKARTIIWAAGVKASEAAIWFNVKPDLGGRILVNSDLSIPSHPHVFAIGDTSACLDNKTGMYLPGVASVAKQQGKYVGSLIARKLRNKKISPFRYRNFGNLATIGRKYAIADFGRLQINGMFTYLIWWLVHIYFLIGFRNRLVVFVNWLWSYFTFQRGARLILREALSADKKDI